MDFISYEFHLRFLHDIKHRKNKYLPLKNSQTLRKRNYSNLKYNQIQNLQTEININKNSIKQIKLKIKLLGDDDNNEFITEAKKLQQQELQIIENKNKILMNKLNKLKISKSMSVLNKGLPTLE